MASDLRVKVGLVEVRNLHHTSGNLAESPILEEEEASHGFSRQAASNVRWNSRLVLGPANRYSIINNQLEGLRLEVDRLLVLGQL